MTNSDGPLNNSSETHACFEKETALWDGTKLFYRVWKPKKESKKALLIFHRGHEHSGRFQDLIDKIGLDDFTIFAWDARGHGKSPGERGWAPSFGHLVRDVDSFVHNISQEHGFALEDMVIFGHSVGAVTVATWVHDYAPPIRGLVVATPALRVKLYVPLAIPGLRLINQLKPKAFVKSYVKGKMLTHDEAMAEDYATDSLISRDIAVNVLLGLYDAATRLIEDAHAISVPTLVLSGGADWVVEMAPQRKFFSGLASPHRDMKVYPGMYHSILHESDREFPIEDAREFIKDAFETPKAPLSLIHEDQSPHSTEKKIALIEQLGLLDTLKWKITRLAMNTLGRLSGGIQVGWKYGFDSGSSLDYVYRNKACGISPLGRLLDRLYLESPGWKGIRQRKINLEELLEKAICRVAERNEPVRMLDIAAGPGRYMLDILKKHEDLDIAAVLRDRDPAGIEEGRAIAKEMGLTNARHEEGDAFSADSIARVEPKPNIAIVSGLYELFDSNEKLRTSLAGLAKALPMNGYLIYTNQPWHPQLDFIARVLPNRDGDPWVMRCRSQAEMDQLVAEAGFKKIDMRIDEWGIFTVSIAIKTEDS